MISTILGILKLCALAGGFFVFAILTASLVTGLFSNERR